jgi:hypothetical protein
MRPALCENFFRPRADSTLDVADNSLYCHARVGEGKGNFQFPCLLAKKISRKASAYAPLRRKTKRARTRVQHDNDKDTTKAKNNGNNKTIIPPKLFFENIKSYF